MKKWLITYAFMLCFLAVSLCSQSAPAPANSVQSSWKFVSKKSFSWAGKSNDRGQENYQRLHHHLRLTLSAIPPFILEANRIPISSDDVIMQPVIEAEVERVLKDQLLHLFPFHFFW